MFHDETSKMNFSPKMSFILGLVAGLLVLCTIGFFILLTMTLRGGLSRGTDTSGTPIAAAPTPTPSANDNPVMGDPKAVGANEPFRGGKNATVTLIEYSDFQCPFCQRFDTTMQQVMKEYGTKVRWVYRHFPLSNIHPEAINAANASECAAEQGKFWEYADGLFANQSSLSPAFYSSQATKLGLNKSKFDSCFSTKKYQSKVTADQTEGSSIGVNGTPGTFVIGPSGYKQYIAGAYPFEQVKTYIDAALGAK